MNPFNDLNMFTIGDSLSYLIGLNLIALLKILAILPCETKNILHEISYNPCKMRLNAKLGKLRRHGGWQGGAKSGLELGGGRRLQDDQNFGGAAKKNWRWQKFLVVQGNRGWHIRYTTETYQISHKYEM